MEKEIIKILKKYTSHNFIRLTSRGDTAILAAFKCIKTIKGNKPILTADQGGWISYLKYSKQLGIEVKLCKTDYSLIDLDDLKEKSKGCATFIYAQPGGYFVNQPIKEVYNICKKNNCIVIIDITGSIGTKLCNGKYADFLICSFGDYKPINLGYGGFISTNKEEYFSKEIFNEDNFNKDKLPQLLKKLEELEKRQELFNKINKKIKNDLKNFEIIHKNKKGINVLVKSDNEEEKNEIIKYCETNNFKYKVCKKVSDSTKNLFSFIKVNENAISIEVQRL